jgi:hypothetical protein
MSDKKTNKTFYLAHTPSYPGYWGKHADGIHHAIANACDEGADRFGIFSVWEGPESMGCDFMGSVFWDEGDPEPTQVGIYTAAGCYLGQTLSEVAKDVQSEMLIPDEFALSRDTVRALKTHKPIKA